MNHGTTLIVVAHVDDETLSCGGLIQELDKEKSFVHILTVFGRQYNYGKGDQYVEEQYQHFNNAMGRLCPKGNWTSRHLNLVEGEPYSVGYYPVLRELEETLSRINPTTVVIPANTDLNQDHRHLHEICRIALRPAALQGIRTILQSFGLDGGTPPGVNYVTGMDAEMMEIKLQAVTEYSRELKQPPHPRSLHNIEAYHRLIGSIFGLALAEPYKLLLHRKVTVQEE